MPIAVEQVIYLLERQMAAVRIWGIYLRIAQNYYENLKEKTTTTKLQQNQNLYILQQRLCCHHYFEHWFYVTWQRYEENKREKKKKEKEKKKKKDIRSNFANADMNQQGRRKRVGRLWIIRSSPAPSIFYYLVKEKWSKFPISQQI